MEATTIWLLGIGLFVLLFFIGVGIYIWFALMPSIRDMRKTSVGQRQVLKAVFPPRFHR
jgi:uncharacterized membrane protein